MPTTEQTRTTSILLWLAGFLLIFGLLFGIRRLTRETVGVHVANPSLQNLTSTVSTNGKVEPVEPYQAHAPAAGVIDRLYVQVGQHISAGELLVRMDDSDAKARVATAAATLAGAQSSLETLERGGTAEQRSQSANGIASAQLERQQAADNLRTVQQLQAKGAASAGEVATAQQRLTAAELSLTNATQRSQVRADPGERSSAGARVTDARASLAAAQSAMAGVAIRSPIPGSVYYIPVAQYDFVPAGDELLDVADLTRIQVRAYFDEPVIGRLAVGQQVKIVWDAKPTQAWHGHIERAPTTVITYGTRNVGECIITVDDALGDLLPNTNVTVTVTEKQRLNALSIPREALHTEGARDFVFRVQSGKLVRTPVQVGVVNLTSVEILGGLTRNDTIALGSALSGKDLTDGEDVTIVR